MIKTFLVMGFIVTGIIGLSSMSAHAERNLKIGDKAASFSLAFQSIVIGGRYFISPDQAILAEVAFRAVSTDDNSGTDLKIGGGFRQYLRKQSELHSFVEGTLAYSSLYNPNNGDNNSFFSLRGMAGLEYFLAKQVSAEAAAGIEFNSDSFSSTTHNP